MGIFGGLSSEKKLETVFLIILGLFLIFNLADLPNYGITWDEPNDQEVGRVALNYIKGDGQIKFENPWLPNLIYYGPFFATVRHLLSGFFENYLNFSYIDSLHVPIVLIVSLGLFFFYKLTALMFGGRIALIASLFLMLSPRFIAHAHYNPRDIPVAIGLIIIMYFLYRGFKFRSLKQIILAGVAFGITLGIRMDSLIILPIFLLAYCSYLLFSLKITERADRNKILIDDVRYIFWLFLVSLSVLFIVWPSLWSNPSLIFGAIGQFLNHAWHGRVLYLGQIYVSTELPWHYSLVFLVFTNSIVILVLFIFGVWHIFKKIKSKDSILEYSLLAFWTGIPVIIASFPNAPRYDGMRHLLLVVPAIMIVASLGFNYLFDKFVKCFKPKTYSPILSIILIWLIIEFAIIYPFGDSYFNELVRLFGSPSLEKKLEIEYWGASYRQGMGWLNKNARPNSKICVPIVPELIDFYPKRNDLIFKCSPNSNYLMFITRYSHLSPIVDKVYNFSEKTPALKLSRYNSDLLYIYDLN